MTAQAVTLNTMFTHLANMAAKTEYDDKLDRYMRLALKAQGQCRATLETPASIKNRRWCSRGKPTSPRVRNR